MCDACRDAVITIAKNHAAPDEMAPDLSPDDLDRIVEGILRRTLVAFSVRVRQREDAPQEIVHDYISNIIAACEHAGIDLAVDAQIMVGRLHRRPLEASHPPGTILH